jgi:acylphosphatase
MTVRAHIFIEGRVQGVFFRSYMREKANQLKVSGWVRNLPDGRVEAVLEGEEPNVSTLISWCQQGPPSARVTNIETKWEQATGEFSTFNIRY